MQSRIRQTIGTATWRRVVGVSLAILSCSPGANGTGLRASGRYAIAPVHLIDGTGAAMQRDVAVVIEGDRVAAVLPAAELDSTAMDRVVDGQGRYAIPGLWDMHVHFQEMGPEQMALFPAWGVTSIREMGDRPDVVRARRAAIRSGELVGPRIKASMFMLDAPFLMDLIRSSGPEGTAAIELERRIEVGTEEEARAAVRRAKAAGADFVKIHAIDSRAAYRALADECEQLGLRFAGHQPSGDVTLDDWIEARQHSVEHLLGGFGRLFDLRPEGEQAALYQRFADAGVYFVPTLVVNEALVRLNPGADIDAKIEIALDDPQARYVTDELEAFWRGGLQMSPPQMPGMNAFARELHHLRELHAAGVGVMPGTDVGVPMVFPGSSLHDELRLFVDVLDMTEMEAIESATRVPAEFFGMSDSLGTLVPGKIADVVLLAGDPLEDIEQTRSVRAVVIGGKYHDRADIDRWLDGARVR